MCFASMPSRRDLAVLRRLLRMGADPSVRARDDGATAAEMARRGMQPAVAEELEAWDGRRALELARAARTLGFDLRAEPGLLYVAERYCSAPLPEGWVDDVDD